MGEHRFTAHAMPSNELFIDPRTGNGDEKLLKQRKLLGFAKTHRYQIHDDAK